MASAVIAVAKTGRPSAAMNVRSTLQAICGIIDQHNSAMKLPAIFATCGSCPAASMIVSPNWQSVMPPRPSNSESHSAIRTERRTSRTAWRIRPSSAAISGATAPVSPEKHHIISPNSEVERLAAASGSCPSRATKITSTA